MQLKQTGDVSIEHMPGLQILLDFYVRIEPFCRVLREMGQAAGKAQSLLFRKLHLAPALSLQVLTGTPHSILSDSNSTTLNQGCTSLVGASRLLSSPAPPHQLLEIGKRAFHFTSCWSSNLPLPVATKLTFGKHPAAGSDLKQVQRRAGRMDRDWFNNVTSLSLKCLTTPKANPSLLSLH